MSMPDDKLVKCKSCGTSNVDGEELRWCGRCGGDLEGKPPREQWEATFVDTVQGDPIPGTNTRAQKTERGHRYRLRTPEEMAARKTLSGG